MMLALLLVPAQPPPSPETVNGVVIGEASDFSVHGPGRICLERTGMDLLSGEIAYLSYRGIHIGGVRVMGPYGHFEIREAENWARPESPFILVRSAKGSEIERHRRDGRSAYLFYGRSEADLDSDGLTPVAWVQGPALNGSTRDARILRRIDVNMTDPSSCSRQFSYGWEYILGPAEDDDATPKSASNKR